MTIRASTDYIFIHCSATKPSVYVDADVIRSWHKAKGYIDIGYNLVITRAGNAQIGRSLEDVGAQVLGFNHNSLGICLVGGLNEQTGKAENNYTSAQFLTLKTWLRALKTVWPSARILGHRDAFPDRNHDGIIDKRDWLKECPCFDVAQWLKEAGV